MKKINSGLSLKQMKVGKWLYFCKMGKRGPVGKVLGRGYFLGVKNGKYVFHEGRFWNTYCQNPSEVYVYDLGGDQQIAKSEAVEILKTVA